MRAGWVSLALGAAFSIMGAVQPVTARPAVELRVVQRATVERGPPRGRELVARLLDEHNRERARLGIAPLRWSAKLELAARDWGEVLASRDRLEHASYAGRGGAGENLWMGTAGHYDPESMVDAFVAEGNVFRPGQFPDVSETGRWQDVGHYTQLIWPGTQEVGCALANNARNDFLVCRYWPAGNTVGARVP